MGSGNSKSKTYLCPRCGKSHLTSDQYEVLIHFQQIFEDNWQDMIGFLDEKQDSSTVSSECISGKLQEVIQELQIADHHPTQQEIPNVKYYGKCAQAVREIVEKTYGIKIRQVQSAKDYAQSYIEQGYTEVIIDQNNPPQDGDICIQQPKGTGQIAIHGHISIYSNGKWVSYWIQKDIYPNFIYRDLQYKGNIYRKTK